MTENQQTILMIKGLVADQSKQEEFSECYHKLKEIIENYGEIGSLALATIGAEMSE
jgi:hypothetical protein